LLSHPSAEGLHQLRFFRSRLRLTNGWLLNTLQVSQEEPCASEHVSPIRTSEAAAITFAKMATEAFENSLVEILDGQTSAARPPQQMFRRSNVVAGGYLRVATFKQLFGKAFNQCPGWPAANGSDPAGCFKVL
jgi:hypothetical protein